MKRADVSSTLRELKLAYSRLYRLQAIARDALARMAFSEVKTLSIKYPETEVVFCAAEEYTSIYVGKRELKGSPAIRAITKAVRLYGEPVRPQCMLLGFNGEVLVRPYSLKTNGS